MLSETQLNELRKKLKEYLINYEGIEKIKIDEKVLEKVIFKYEEDEHEKKYKTFAFDEKLIQKLDLSNISFDDFKAENFDFNGFYGVCINPQTIYEKNLYNTVCNGVKFNGSFDDCVIVQANFTGSIGAIIDPQTIYKKDLNGTICNGVSFIGPFDDCDIVRTNFTGSIGAKINPKKFEFFCLETAIFNDVTFIEEIEYNECLKKINEGFQKVLKK